MNGKFDNFVKQTVENLNCMCKFISSLVHSPYFQEKFLIWFKICPQVVNKIGEFCKCLVDLNLSGTPITDKGLVLLCVAEDGQRKCQKLARLSISETYISVAGATVALHFLPNLREFDFDNVFEVLMLFKLV